MRSRWSFLVIGLVAVLLIGFVAGFRSGHWWNTSSPVAATPGFTLIYNAQEHPEEKLLLAQTVQAQLKMAGIDVRLEPLPSATYNDRISKGTFQAALTLWYLDYNDPEGFLTDFYSKAGYRLSKYSNSQYDKTYLSALFAPTEQEKIARYHAAEAILDRDLPWVPILSNDEIFLFQPAASGFRSNAFQYYDYRRVALPHIRAATDIEIQTFDPAQAYDLASKQIVTQSYEGLIAMDEHNAIVPALATSWEFSDDGTALTFNLRPSVRFQKCTFLKGSTRTVTAGDVKASFERLIKANSPYSYIFDHVMGIATFKSGGGSHVSGFVVDGPLKFTIRLQRPFPTMLPWLLAPAAYVLPAGLPSDYNFSGGSCGTGPFRLASWDGSQAQFVANPDYWLAEDGHHLPLATTLSIRVIQDANVQLAAFEQHQLDIMNGPVALFSTILNSDGSFKLKWQDYGHRVVQLNNLQFVAFNMASQGWGDTAVFRNRVSQALGRRAIVKDLYYGKAEPEMHVVPFGMAGFGG